MRRKKKYCSPQGGARLVSRKNKKIYQSPKGSGIFCVIKDIKTSFPTSHRKGNIGFFCEDENHPFAKILFCPE